MSKSEMEELIKLQKETIESLRQLVESQQLTIEQRKLFVSSSEKAKTDVIPGQIDLFNEAEAAADPSVPEPTLEEAVGGYNTRQRNPRPPGKRSWQGFQ